MVAAPPARPRWPGRLILVWLHRWAGLMLAAFLVMAGLTGSVLAFDEPLDAWLNTDLFDASPGPAQPVDALIAAVQLAESSVQIGMVSYPTPARGTVLLRVGGVADYDQVFVDPATARVLGWRDSAGCCLSRRQLMPFLFRLHYTLAAGQIGQWVMGGVALLWTMDCFVGLWLTFPRIRPFLAQWWPKWRIKPTRNSFRLSFDLHRAGGLWCWGLLLVMAVSGVALTLRTEVFQPVLSALLPVTPDVWTQSRPVTGPPVLSFGTAAAGAVAEAARSGPARTPAFVYYVPRAGIYGVGLQAPGIGVEAGWGPDIVYIGASDGTVLRNDRAGHGHVGDLVLQLQYPLHSGQIAGLTGRIAVCVLGLVVAMLAVTGVYIWWRKRSARRRRA